MSDIIFFACTLHICNYIMLYSMFYEGWQMFNKSMKVLMLYLSLKNMILNIFYTLCFFIYIYIYAATILSYWGFPLGLMSRVQVC